MPLHALLPRAVMSTAPKPPPDPPDIPQRLRGKTALITGGGTGLGLAIARRFLLEGASVAITGRREAVLQDACAVLDEEIRARPRPSAHDAPRSLALAMDVADERSVGAAFEGLADLGFHPGILVANAGIAGPIGSLTDYPSEDWERVMRTNVLGVMLTVRYGLPLLRQAGHGAILTISSVAGFAGVRNLSGYATSKAAVFNLTRSLALDHAAEGIRANCIAPGFIPTDINRMLFEQARDPEATRAKLLENYPLRRLGECDDVAPAAAFLCSDEASWITGVILAIDGGFSCRLV